VSAFRIGSATLALLVLLAPRADASPMFELLGAVNGVGGLNARSAGPGSASAYFNPALLTAADEGFDYGVFTLTDLISIRALARPAGTAHDVPVGAPDYRSPDDSAYSQKPVPTAWLEQGHTGGAAGSSIVGRPRQAAGTTNGVHPYHVIGAVKRLWRRYAVLGFFAVLPLSEIAGQAAFYNDEREQFFSNSLHPELYADRLRAQSMSFALASEPIEGLSLGVALTLNLHSTATTPSYVPNAVDVSRNFVDSEIGVKSQLAPHFGLSYRPLPWLQLSGTLHTEQKVVTETQLRVLFPSQGEEQISNLRFVHDFVPLTASLGGTAHLLQRGRHGLGVTGSAIYMRWSQYVDRHGERPFDDYAWGDTISGSGGLRYGYDGALDAFLDLAFFPSPVPPQTGRRNYVDNNRLGLSLGAVYRFEVLGLAMSAGIQVQLHRLFARSVAKFGTPPPDDDWHYPQLVVDEVPDDAIHGSGVAAPGRGGLQTNNPGWPGFASDGWIIGGGAHLSVKL
jgi:hypothetical protein